MKYKLVLAVGHEQITDQIKKFDEVEVVEENGDIEIIEEVMEFVDADFAVINTMLSAEKSLHFAQRAQQMQVKVICIVADFKMDRKLILSLAGCGVTAFVQIDELYRIPECLEAYPEQFDYQLLQDHAEEGETAGAKSAVQKRKTTVAVLGIMPRIGTTTHALSLAKYLNDRGYKTAYIELNGSDYIRQLAATYTAAEEDAAAGKVTYEGLDMYYDPGSVPKALRLPYLFYIYDFGDIHGLRSREQITWLEKDIKVLVAGTKPNEIDQFQYAVKQVYNQNTKYLFNFCSQAEQHDVKVRMGSRTDATYFASWLPDPFATVDENVYLAEMMADALAKAGDVTESVKESKAQKSGFWRRKR
ncbi:hypothetical protein D1155_09075 [Anaerotruncus sp. 80]|uniref:Flp pilus assembly protein, ATPase CpaE n=1 Tax=Anaerotruncus colihominis TaxID=169435 RepID=A0A845QL55_9FIRM|nr:MULTISPECIES: hypothetical protein [Anaerotruncus]NBH61801.1 hypothetical protein [Anaerotruncus colihominis]NCF02456.1 hypothetical protein [Anaerotruncus sp. 80]